MKELRPKLFDVMKGYTKEQLIKDIISGIIVAIIALPLSIALAIASGVNPERGLYTAIIAGFFISFFGGSRVQIGGPTAAFVVIIYGIVQQYGMDGLTVAALMAGAIMIVMGICRFGGLIKYIPYTITTGFTAGIAIGIFAGQIKDFLGLSMGAVPSEFIEKMIAYGENLGSINWWAVAVGAVSLIIMIIWPFVTEKIPNSLVAIIAATLLVKIGNLPVNTIGSVYGQLSSSLPAFHIPTVSMELISNLFQPAFTIAILAAIESLLSCVVADGMIGSRHKPNAELIGQGLGNIMSSLFGGIPATGAIARTAANIKNGGRTPIAGMVHSVTLLLILVILMPLAALIPMPTLAAVLFMVAYNMSGWRTIVSLTKTAPKSDILVMYTTFFLTVVFDLVVAIEVGIVLAAILFMKRMADVTGVTPWKYQEDGEEEELLPVPAHTRVFEISGPMFFAAADEILGIQPEKHTKVIVIRMRSVPAIDATALHSLEGLYERCHRAGIQIILSHVQEQPMKAMEKGRLKERIGEEYFAANITEAIRLAETIN